MDSVFAKRLANARKIKCMSIRELCTAMGGLVSPNAISRYEKGVMMPSSTVLIGLSEALGMEIDYFFRPFSAEPDPSLLSLRKIRGLRAKKAEAIKHMVCSEIDRQCEIETILNLSFPFTLGYKDKVISTLSEAREMALRLRKEQGLGTSAVISAFSLMEGMGVRVIETEIDEHFTSTGGTFGSTPVIALNKNMASEQKRLAVFQELGRILLKFAEDADEETLSTAFADEVLIPSERLRCLIGDSRKDISIIELQSIQKEYGVSIDTLVSKLVQLGIITRRRYDSYQKRKSMQPSFRQSVMASLYPMECSEQFERLVYRALTSEIITQSKAAALLNIPTHTVLQRVSSI